MPAVIRFPECLLFDLPRTTLATPWRGSASSTPGGWHLVLASVVDIAHSSPCLSCSAGGFPRVRDKHVIPPFVAIATKGGDYNYRMG